MKNTVKGKNLTKNKNHRIIEITFGYTRLICRSASKLSQESRNLDPKPVFFSVLRGMM